MPQNSVRLYGSPEEARMAFRQGRCAMLHLGNIDHCNIHRHQLEMHDPSTVTIFGIQATRSERHIDPLLECLNFFLHSVHNTAIVNLYSVSLETYS